jgi:hypothetical protein
VTVDGAAHGEQSATYAAEDAHERAMPSRTMNVDEARAWLTTVAHAEDIEVPVLVVRRNNGRAEACAVREHSAIITYRARPSAHALLHEVAHLACANPSHGREFRSRLVGLVRRHVSLPHAANLHAEFAAHGLAVDPFEATAR